MTEQVNPVDTAFIERQRVLLEALSLPLVAPVFDHDQLVDLMRRDKKVDDGKLRFVLPDRMGHVELVKDVNTNDVLASLKT